MPEAQSIKPAKLAHFVIKTTKYETLIEWYKTVLGMEVAFGNASATFLTFDDEHHRMAILNVPALLPNLRGAAGVDHVAFTFASVDDLLKTYERLKEIGITPVWPVNHGATLSFYYKDPDHNMVELQVDVFASRAETDALLSDGRFAINPIGVDVDPEELLARWKAGAGHDELTAWPEVMEPRRVPPPAGYIGKVAATMLKIGRLFQRSP